MNVLNYGRQAGKTAFLDVFGPILVLKDSIESATAFKPNAILIPESMKVPDMPTITRFWGMRVIWSADVDTPSLVYVPTKEGD